MRYPVCKPMVKLKNAERGFMKSVFFHEDDFCQIEILPAESLGFCLQQADCVAEFADAHKTDMGYSDMYVREAAPVSLHSKKISDTILQNLLGKLLPEFEEVYTGYGSSRTKCKNIKAFGQDENVVLFYESENNVVKNIWLTLNIKKKTDIAVAKNIFDILSQTGDFLIADWSWDFVELLSNAASIDSYLEKVRA